MLKLQPKPKLDQRPKAKTYWIQCVSKLLLFLDFLQRYKRGYEERWFIYNHACMHVYS